MPARPAAPRVSVITATYNWSSVLRYAIESVRWQTFMDFELLVVGDGCTDDSEAVVTAFGDPRISWTNLPENSGSQAMPNNAGLEMARGAYVAYLGHDDLWLPNHLAALVDAIERAEADVSYTLAAMIGPPGSGFRVVTGLSESGTYEPGASLPSSVLHRRVLAREIGGWRDHRTLHIPTDKDFFDRAWDAGKRFVAVNAVTVVKLPSAWRRNSYRERRADEQATYARRIRTEGDFLVHELLAIVASYALEMRLRIATPPPIPADAPPGWLTQHWRTIRGLEPDSSATANAGGNPPIGARGVDFQPGRVMRTAEAYARTLERALTEREAEHERTATYLRAIEEAVAEKDRQLVTAAAYARGLEETIAGLEWSVTELQQAIAAKDRQQEQAGAYARDLETALAAIARQQEETHDYVRRLENTLAETARHQQETKDYLNRLEAALAEGGQREEATRDHLAKLEATLGESERQRIEEREAARAYAQTLEAKLAENERQERETAAYVRTLEAAIAAKERQLDEAERYARSIEQVISSNEQQEERDTAANTPS